MQTFWKGAAPGAAGQRGNARGSEVRPSLTAGAFRFACVLGLHLAFVAWAMQTQPGAPARPAPKRMDVRIIELPAQVPPPSPAPVVRKTPQARAQPAPQAARRPLVRPAAPLAVPAADSVADHAPAGIATSPQPSPIAGEEAPPAPAPVTAARFDADYLQNPAPVFPPLSRKLREQGKVLLQVLVSPDGEPEDVQVKQSSGFLRLDEAALSAVRKWRFIPARRGTQTVASSVVVPLVFRLDS